MTLTQYHEKYGHSVEQKLNSVTHSVGAGLSIAGMVFLLALTRLFGGGGLKYLTFSIYGACQILLYLSSALMHQFYDRPKARYYFRILDHISIYLLIAGTYTPVALVGIRGAAGWTMFGIIWGLALVGIFFKVFVYKEKHIVSDLFYLPMGWLILGFVKPMLNAFPPGFLMWMLIGGVTYSIGIIFYLSKRIPYSHVIWHLFVIAGGVSFYLGFAFYLL